MGLRKIEEVKSGAHINFLEEELRVGTRKQEVLGCRQLRRSTEVGDAGFIHTVISVLEVLRLWCALGVAVTWFL